MSEFDTQNVVVQREGKPLVVGAVVYSKAQAGWRFVPTAFQAQSSRKFHPTAEAAVRCRIRNFTLEPRQ